jgi:uncharacterized protein YvpB
MRTVRLSTIRANERVVLQGGGGMHRSLAVVAALVMGVTTLGIAAAPVGAASANSWITIGTTRPGVGCSVAVSVEVRASGNPVSGVSVEVVYFDSGQNVLDSDQTTTDGDGIASLSFDTSGSSAGSSDWLDIDVDGGYATGTSIVPTSGGDCSGDSLELTANPNVTASSGDDSSGGDYPTHYQEHSLSCEYASLQIATTALGNPIAEDTFMYDVPSAVDPHFGYRGDIDGAFGSTDDYGVYAEPLVAALADQGFSGEVSYDPSAGTIEAQLDAGHPTLVWIATHGDTSFYDEDANGNSFKLVPYEHVVVAYAYDDSGIFVSDPGNGSLEHFSWGWFLSAWGVMDGMALSVSN